MPHDPHDDVRSAPAAPLAEVGRRKFLSTAAAAVVGAPVLLGACDNSPAAPSEGTASPTSGTARFASMGIDPWIAVAHQIAATVGSASNVNVPALEKSGTNSYLQRVVTDDDRTGTGLATVLRSSYKWTNASGVTSSMAVYVVATGGKRWPARTVVKKGDLAYAMKDAFATNTLSEGVLKESLELNKPIVALFKSAVVQFEASATSDYYGNQLEVLSRSACDIFNPSVGGFAIASTTRDPKRC